MRLHRPPRAVTLIELLIVCAIMAIFAASLLAVVTAPAEERVFADVDNTFESGAATLFGALVADAHAAQRLEVGDKPTALVFMPSRPGDPVPVYFVDPVNQVRRALVDADQARRLLSGDTEGSDLWRQRGGSLVPDVARLQAERIADERSDSGPVLWRISLLASHRQLGREQILDRRVDVAVGLHESGLAGKGGAR